MGLEKNPKLCHTVTSGKMRAPLLEKGPCGKTHRRFIDDPTEIVICCKKFICSVPLCLENYSLALKTVEANHPIQNGREMTFSEKGL